MDTLTKLKQWKSISVHLQLLKIVLFSNRKDLLILLLDLLDVRVLLDALKILLLPVAHLFKLGLFQLLEAKSLLVIVCVQSCLWILG